MSGHTPGPWSVGHTSRQNIDSRLPEMHQTAVHVGDESNAGNCLAIVYLGGDGALRYDPESVQANAHLIAAAPAMLEALKAWERWYSEDSTEFARDSARIDGLSAIAAAEAAQGKAIR